MTASEPAKARAVGKKVAAPTAFIGIENPNEFFTHHYLTAILQGELRPVLERWRDVSKTSESGATKQLPPQALGACQQDFFRYLDRLEQQRSPEVRVTGHFEMYCELLAPLGYSDILSHRIGTLPAGHVPLYGEVKQADGSPLLWILPVVPAQGHERGTLSTPIAKEQLIAAQFASDFAGDSRPTGDLVAEQLVNEAFNLDEPPRFILLLGLDDIILLERAKWAEQRLLRFELREILGRRQVDTLDVTAALLHRDSLVPRDGIPLLDDLDDSSHKHAYAVSEDLKYALQASIERLGNAAVEYLRKVRRQKAPRANNE